MSDDDDFEEVDKQEEEEEEEDIVEKTKIKTKKDTKTDDDDDVVVDWKGKPPPQRKYPNVKAAFDELFPNTTEEVWQEHRPSKRDQKNSESWTPEFKKARKAYDKGSAKYQRDNKDWAEANPVAAAKRREKRAKAASTTNSSSDKKENGVVVEKNDAFSTRFPLTIARGVKSSIEHAHNVWTANLLSERNLDEVLAGFDPNAIDAAKDNASSKRSRVVENGD